jgi:tRNA nucleotidyltransferase (CCA-adding enzyme)
MVLSGDDLLARLARLPAGARLLAVLDAPDAEPARGGRRAPPDGGPLAGIWLVGGAVRDLALDRSPGELDLAVCGDAGAVASELGRRLEGAGRAHELFGTHTIDAGGLRVDVAMARAETYPRPGALPDVRPAASIEEDLLRRDFTVNAFALGVSADVRGRLAGAPSAAQDLEGRRLRVLHDASFLDDPTRLLRLVRYAARLGFAVHPRTEQLARAAFASGAPRTAGVSRMGGELMLLLGEEVEVAVAALVLLRELGGGEELVVEPDRLRAAAAALPAGGRSDLVLLAALARGTDERRLRAWLAGMHLRREDAATVLDAARDPESLATAMRAAERPSQLARLLRHRALEAVALAATFDDAAEPARRWFDELRSVALQVTGKDLLAAGVPEGPELGRRLAAALDRKLDDGLASRDDELAAALDHLA